ncbi:hypothetical protein PSJE_19945 [Pseudomonas jessenii]|jgi:RHS repeat-associated protein|uniref:RHS repeat-associated core domain-containing protein n=2 Tax=Pseudomonas TaxID=286 RepID=A0A231GCB5_PSEJE|nr:MULTISPECIES: RHS repeat-associated core domain-containing protein [Pseudomonas]OXR34259.1 hypothetical protein PSJE_19945 [Pseudomonas jessenii]SEB56247.1 RHS repeat-associated core domain-containing protein [Pseudomonas jessenii]VVP93609.1 hypothetical protein PS922_02963 [Pseudomonas fluorescens]
MPADAQDVLCRYQYDPLDRLIGTTPSSDAGLQRFYCKSRLATEIQDEVQRSIFQQGEQLLAQQSRQGDLVETSILATDQMHSVSQVVKANRLSAIAYSPYGHRPAGGGLLSLLGFNGERTDSFTGHYLLGNGYRAFNPVLMRFNSPDNLSPFGKGGLNPYVYCLGDPINRNDESGHFSLFKAIRSAFRFFKTKKGPPVASTAGSKLKKTDTLYRATTSRESLVESSPELFKNRHPTSPEEYMQHYNNRPEEFGPRRVPLTRVSLAKDLEHVDISERTKFVYTDKRDFIIGSDTTHPTLSAYVNRSTVISAGYIRQTGNQEYAIAHRSGHYQPPYRSLYPVKEFLEGMGARVNLLRHEDWLKI